MIEAGDGQSKSRQQRSEESMNDSPMSGSIVEEKPYTTLTTVPEQRYSPPKSTSMVFQPAHALGLAHAYIFLILG